MGCFYQSTLNDEDEHGWAPAYQPRDFRFNKGSMLDRLEKGETVQSIRSHMPAPRKKKSWKLKHLFSKRTPVELPAEPVPRKVELAADASTQKKFVELDSIPRLEMSGHNGLPQHGYTELDSHARIELPTNPSVQAIQKEESKSWESRLVARRAAGVDGCVGPVPELPPERGSSNAIELEILVQSPRSTATLYPTNEDIAMDAPSRAETAQRLADIRQIAIPTGPPTKRDEELEWLTEVEKQIQARKAELLSSSASTSLQRPGPQTITTRLPLNQWATPTYGD